MPTKITSNAVAPKTRGRTSSSATAPTAVRSAAAPQRSPGRSRSDVSRMAILAATLKLLEQQSLQQISIEGIAREAGVGKATIYRWWKSKAAVVIEAFLLNHVSHTPMPRGGSPRLALARHIHLLIEQYAGWSGRIVSQIVAEGQSEPDVLREFRERFWYGRQAMVREVVDDARRCGEFRTDMEPESQMDLMYSPIYVRLLMHHLPLDKNFADAHCATVMRLLAAPEGAAVAAASVRKKKVA